MSLTSITSNATAFTPMPLTPAASVDKSVNAAALSNDQSPSKTVDTDVVDINDINKVSVSKKQSADVNAENKNKPARAMTHVVVSYNQEGKVRTKFMDSNNNVVYQIPTEMMAKMEDLMMKLTISTDEKA